MEPHVQESVAHIAQADVARNVLRHVGIIADLDVLNNVLLIVLTVALQHAREYVMEDVADVQDALEHRLRHLLHRQHVTHVMLNVQQAVGDHQ